MLHKENWNFAYLNENKVASTYGCPNWAYSSPKPIILNNLHIFFLEKKLRFYFLKQIIYNWNKFKQYIQKMPGGTYKHF